MDGVVDLPNDDTMFRRRRCPRCGTAGPAGQRAFVLQSEWHALFDPQAAARPDRVRLQMHALIDRANLPSIPGTAYAKAVPAGHNLEARMAGKPFSPTTSPRGLDAAGRLYAEALFLFLGAPGAVVAVLLTVATTAAGRGTTPRPVVAAGSRGLGGSHSCARSGGGVGRGLDRRRGRSRSAVG